MLRLLEVDLSSELSEEGVMPDSGDSHSEVKSSKSMHEARVTGAVMSLAAGLGMVSFRCCCCCFEWFCV